ncbi:MAG: hypothetical protein HGA51_06930 [Demequinaceae bacterium]|nr:hypothetical protein [Demequinaceae bacterium]
MRVVAAVQGWPAKYRIDAKAAATMAGQAWAAAAPGAELVTLPMGGGGPRSADVWRGARGFVDGAETIDHDGATWLAPTGGSSRWNPIDVAAALFGLAKGGRTVVIPVGDDAIAGDAVELWSGSLSATKKFLTGLDIVVLVSSRRPLLGFDGMSAALLDGKEGDARVAAASQAQEERWQEFAAHGDEVGNRSTLLGPSRLSDEPGTGAAAGLAYALAAVGARLVPASQFIADAAGLSAEVAKGADLVLGIGPELTPRALDHGIAAPVAAAAAAHGIPAAVLAPGVRVGKRDLMAAGIDSAHEAEEGPEGLSDGVRRLAQTWAR